MEDEKILGNLYEEFEMVSKENALKLEQILDLEETLYAVRILDEDDGSPCWCCMPAYTNEESGHADDCEKARKLTSHLWKEKKING